MGVRKSCLCFPPHTAHIPPPMVAEQTKSVEKLACNVEDMETTELEAAALELLEREKRRQKEIDDKTEKEE